MLISLEESWTHFSDVGEIFLPQIRAERSDSKGFSKYLA